ncbi:malonate--CoA ligase ACSF3, mitochondrial isoform X2 [Venturia canescens]|uniref:malonate--CoA ligase ACSF3, mitochondrial isoform X2 n=1 Tax=Venturia canescens TaxID=32260 RepID=UPI001C9C84CC|nr:malonate--CoA ligase ACSF3, mitochondrial isoform X2 [Venturia canescens]
MSSLLRRSWYLATNKLSELHRNPINWRAQQSYAAATATVNSSNETHRPSDGVVPVFKRAIQYGERTALRDVQGDYTYRGLFLSSRQFSNYLSKILDGAHQERVAFLLPNNASYVIVQWACWMSGQIAVPLSVSSPRALLDYYIKDSDVRIIVTTSENAPLLEPLIANTNRRLVIFDEALRVLAMKPDGKTANNRTTVDSTDTSDSIETALKDDFYASNDALFIYTSGTTGKPKAVVLTHKNLYSQINSLVTAWKWTEKDNVLHTLPLNHIHGLVNVLLCPLYVGARCVMLPKFETSSVWTQLLGINIQNIDRVNMYMAVPTIYMRLIQEYDIIFSKNAKFKEYVRSMCTSKIRLMVSGSSPLPKPIFDRWEEITGHRLLERYGMTETGMVLSNPLEGERIPGTVGTPLPGVQVRITKRDPNTKKTQILVQGDAKGTRQVTKTNDPPSGNLEVKGGSVFREYWNKPEETTKEFTSDGWFKTGDTVQYESGVYSILGRSSVDIIKTGGFKVSALQVETAILGHPEIVDCAVVGIADETWGQKVAAIVVVREGSEIILSQLREFGKKTLPEHAVPTVLRVVDKIPKNSMGKVNKPELLNSIFSNDQT